MRKWGWLIALLAAWPGAADELKAPVTGAMIFKNGVSAVERTIEPGNRTQFDLACDLVPLQGSLWFFGPVESVVRMNVRKNIPGTYPLTNITKTFAGKQVTVVLAASGNTPVRELTGIVWEPPKPKTEKEEEPTVRSPVMHEDTVWLQQSEQGKTRFEMIPRHQIIAVRCAETPKAAPLPERFDRRPIWRFTLSKSARKPIRVEYLTEGLAWQSAYRIELKKDHKMILSQDAEIINNLADLKDITLYLASGFANFVNKGTRSPMSMIQPSEPGSTPVDPPRVFSNQFMNQAPAQSKNFYQARRSNMQFEMAADSASFGGAETGESEDISLLTLKNFTLKKGEVCHRVLNSAETTYERLVHWKISPRRHPENGRQMGHPESVPMDALRFTNPFPTPITTSPLEILDGGVVLAQVKIPWVNPKQSETVDITKALSLTGKVVEYEVAPQSTERAEQFFYSIERNRGGKTVVGWIAGSRYRVTDVQGEIRLKNYRKLPARMLIELDYSGALVSADDKPAETMLDRTGSVNPRARLTWDIKLDAGAEKIIKYRYNLFVSY